MNTRSSFPGEKVQGSSARCSSRAVAASGWCCTLIVLFLLPVAAPAAEATSNGAGGGLWSEAATWRGNAVTKPHDEVTIRKGDTVLFDRDDEGKTTCHKLFLDPQGALKFKTEAGKIVFVASGPIESFGQIKLDGTRAASDFHELKLTGKTPEDRSVKVEKGGAFLASGKAKLAGGKRNVRIVSKDPDPKATDPSGKIEAAGGTTLDVQQCAFEDMKLQGTDIDNTGAKPNERLNVIGNRFLGRSCINLLSCDTPVVADNLFDYPGSPWHLPPAVAMNGCPLAEVKNNTVRGFYYYAFSIYGCTDAVVMGNLTEKTSVGFYCVGTAMFKGNTTREATSAYVVTSMIGTMEDCVCEKTAHLVYLVGATIQMTNCSYRDAPKDGKGIEFVAGEVTLINCGFGIDGIRLPKVLPKADKPLVTAMHYFILKVKNEPEPDTLVEVRTANPMPALPPGADDLNVRNAPAPLINQRTPLPQSLSPILLRAWMIDKDGRTVPAPEYQVRILGPTDGVKERQVFKTLTVKPADSWYRAKPNDPAPTVEVSLR